MDKDSTTYIFGFAAVVCLVCSVFVSGSAVLLKEQQDENKLIDRQGKVLAVAGLVRADEELTSAEIQTRFQENIIPRVVDLKSGAYVEGVDAALFDMAKAMKDPATSHAAPPNLAKVQRVPEQGLVYQVIDEQEKVRKLIIPVEGKGLWSTLYGYIAIEDDTSTVAGLTFYQHAETPGLGGEVDNATWKGKWKGRKLLDKEGKLVFEVLKGRAGPAGTDPHHMDGLSGATITSRGVTFLLHFWLGENGFGPYLNRFRKEGS